MITFDFETTGLVRPDPCELNLQPHATELYMCKFDWNGKIIAELNTLIKPPISIPEKITQITGIDDNMVANAPEFVEIVDQITDFCLGEKTIFAHNCAFDINMMKIELKRLGLDYNFPWPPRQFCTVEGSFAIQNKRLSLDKLYEIATGKQQRKGSHRAKQDVHDLVKCIVWMKKQGMIHEYFN